MNELKTLQDFEQDFAGWVDKWVNSKQLRAEAVKWVKEMEKQNIILERKDWSLDTKWIKNFFNLTDEDLN